MDQGHGKVAPDLVVEVISPNDLAADLAAKIRDFLNAGVPLIWVVNPESQDVARLSIRQDGDALQGGDILDGGDVLPGFRCPVADLFKI